ncbi:10418_t:CDS:2, partial [Gigaspora margarita]
MAKDFAYRDIPDSSLRVQAVLQRVNIVLQQHSKTISDFDLPELLPKTNSRKLAQLLLKELNYYITPEDISKMSTLNEVQCIIFDIVMKLIDQRTKEFSEYLLHIRNGTEPIIKNNLIWLPDKIVITSQNKQDHISLLLDAIYSNLAENSTNTFFITERAILTPLNNTVNEINKQIVERFSREQYTYFRFDFVPEDTLNLYPIKFLNTLTPQGLSLHILALKINVSIMLLRNLDPVNSLCNRTRLICHSLQMHTINAKIVKEVIK